MKKSVLTLILGTMLTLGAMAQTDVYLRINHKLGTTKFSPNHTASNNLNNDFQVERMDYYISEITLIHDGGQQTPVAGHYIIVKAMEQTNDFLGSFNITNLEGITFGIGVDPGANHSDITTYPSTHPLSFQNPSMHWGWAAGYRFIAMEGKSGSAMNQSWELHALGDGNYGYANVSTTGTMDGTNLIVALDADYEKALNNIAVSGNLNYHGEGGQAVTIMNNFKTLVFSEGAANIGLAEAELPRLQVAPNPANGQFHVDLVNAASGSYEVLVYDLTGKVVSQARVTGSERTEISLDKAGIYLVNLMQEGVILGTSRLVVQ